MSRGTAQPLLKVYHPLPKFPPLSLSATHCELNCRHCSRVYLTSMEAVQTPEALLAACHRLQREGAIGALLSGGSRRDGTMLNLDAPAMIQAIHRAHAESGLIFNLHPGLVDASLAQALRGGVDFASLDIPSPRALRDVLGLDVTPGAYLDSYRRLHDAGIPVAPHVTVFDGTEAELLAPLATTQDMAPPEVIVVIVFTPTRGTSMAEAPPPSPDAVGSVISELAGLFPQSEISLGCMRPRTHGLHLAIEEAALEAGIARIELPTRKTLEIATSRGYAIEHFDACCALPVAFEARATRPESGAHR